MDPKGDSVMAIVIWALATSFVALLVLFSFVGAFLVGLLLIPLLPIVALICFGFLGVRALLAKPELEVEEEAAVEAPSVVEAAEKILAEAPVPVAVKVIGKEGICPISLPCDVGDAWTMNGKWTGPDHLCAYGEKLLTIKAEELRRGDASDGSHFECQGKGFQVLFEIRKASEKEVPIAS